MSKTYPHAYFQYFHYYFLYPRQSVDYFSNKQEDCFALCTFVFVYISATTALHKMPKNQAVEEKYVFIGLVLLIAMGEILDTEKSVSTRISIHPIKEC